MNRGRILFAYHSGQESRYQNFQEHFEHHSWIQYGQPPPPPGGRPQTPHLTLPSWNFTSGRCNILKVYKLSNIQAALEVRRQNSTTAEEVARFQHLFPNPAAGWVWPEEHPVTKTLFQLYSQTTIASWWHKLLSRLVVYLMLLAQLTRPYPWLILE